MKIIKDYSELNKGDIVAASYISEDVLFNIVGEFREIDSDGDLDVKNRSYIKKESIKTVMLLCPVEDKLEIGDVWVNSNGRKYIIGVWNEYARWAVFLENGEYNGTYSKKELIRNSFTLQTKTPTEEMTVSEICKELGREIKITKE